MPEPAEHDGIRVELTLNGRQVSVVVGPADRLLDTLRYQLGLTGTKEGCGEGECGACTVLIDGVPVNSCLVPSYQARGCTVETIESVDAGELGPMLESGATQCGACTPGVVLSARWLIANKELLESHSVRELMAGNLCRCTGYDGIIDGVRAELGGDGCE